MSRAASSWVSPLGRTVPAPPMLTAISSRRSRKFFVPVGLIASSASACRRRHCAADDHAVVVRVGEADPSRLEQLADVEVAAQFVGAHRRGGLGIDGVAGRVVDMRHEFFPVSVVRASARLADAGKIVGLLAAQPAAVALLAGGEMRAHGVARGLRIAGGNGVEDDEMLALQAFLVVARQHALGAPGRGDVAGDGAVAERVEHLDIERIVGCRRDGAVEGEIGLAGRLWSSASSRSNSKNASWIAASCALLRRSAASPALSISMPMRTSSTLSACEILLPMSRLIEPKASVGRSSTKTPAPWRASTSPSAASVAIASRTTVRLTPNVSVSWLSVGSFWPGDISPDEHLRAQRRDDALGELRLAFDANARRSVSAISLSYLNTLGSHSDSAGM